MLKMYCFANPGYSIHEGPDARYHWAIWTLRGGLTGVEDDKLQALAAIDDARQQYPFAQEPDARCPCGEPSPHGAKPCSPDQPCSYGQGLSAERWSRS